MTNLLIIIAAVAAVIYIYAAIAYYKAYKNWYPTCGCTGTSCARRESA